MPSSTEFPNGVASGDVTADSVVLWTRSTVLGEVTFEVATDASFSTIAATQTVTATDADVPVQVDITGLDANTDYVYRVTNTAGISTTGQFSTPATLDHKAGLRFGTFADWEGQLAPFTAIANAAERDLDFFVLLGDTVYADVETPVLPGVAVASTLSEFRLKHNEVYSERFGSNPFAALRQTAPLLATWDDHEIINDFAGGAVLGTDKVNSLFDGDAGVFVNDTTVFDSGLQAFQEFNPLRSLSTGDTGDDRTANETDLYRYSTFGSDAASFVLDTRSFRDAPLTAPGASATDEALAAYFEESFDGDRTLLGNAQLEQFKTDLLAAEAAGVTWKFVMSSVPMQNFGLAVAGERWEGYNAERTEILKFIEENDIDNVVFVSADFHGNVINNVTYQESAGGEQISTSVFDVMVGPVAYEINLPFLIPPFNQVFGAPYGPATAAFSFDPDFINEYTALSSSDDKDQLVKSYVDAQLIDLGYSPIGLEDSTINATVVQGDYINAHTFGWTEFEIDADTQALTITTYGIDPYTNLDLAADAGAIASRTPTIINQILVTPTIFDDVDGSDQKDVLVGSNNEDFIQGFDGDDVLQGDTARSSNIGDNDIIVAGSGNDKVFGGAGNDDLQGQKGDDKILGGEGDDTIDGAKGRDRLQGQKGDDILTGGRGNDILIGGRGTDTYVFESIKDRLDILRDFNVKRETLDFSAIFADNAFDSNQPLKDYVLLEQERNRTVVSLAANGDDNPDQFKSIVILNRVDVADLSRSNFTI
ncbi:MAG: alkaline phosphatase D family protein [Leptolyngbyaceae bacterium]|nr:alkaline phosphatase D family protein [Leptolyngbyaceae bacterium]